MQGRIRVNNLAPFPYLSKQLPSMIRVDSIDFRINQLGAADTYQPGNNCPVLRFAGH